MAERAEHESVRHVERAPSGRPQPGEYADYAASDIAAVDGDDAIDALTAVAARLHALLDPLSDDTVRALTYAPGKWTLKQALGHVVDDERIFAYRALCVARGETGALPGFDQDRYVDAADFEARTLASLLAEYDAVRAATVALLAGLPPHGWTRLGVVNGYAASARGLAFHIVGHELRHLHAFETRYLPQLGSR